MISEGNFWQGFGQGIAVGAFNHALHSGFGGEGDPKVIKTEVKNGSTLTYYDDGTIVEVDASGGGWLISSNSTIKQRLWFPSQAITPTDSPVEWVIGGWKTPFYQIDDFALGFANKLDWKKVMSGSDVAKKLLSEGWGFLRQKGSHMIYGKGGKSITVPNHDEVSIGVLNKIKKLFNKYN